MLPLIGYLVALMSLPVGILFVLGLAATLLAIAWLLESLEPPKVVAVRRPETWPASDRAPVRPRPVTARELVAQVARRDPRPRPDAAAHRWARDAPPRRREHESGPHPRP